MNEPYQNQFDNAQPSEEMDEAKSMDALRNLLFGKKNREIDDKMGSVESRLSESIAALERRLNSRIDALENNLRADNQAEQKIDGIASELNGRFDRLEAKVSSHETNVQNEIAERARVIDGLRATVNGEVAAMKQMATPRGELSDLLFELGRRVQSQSSGNEPSQHD